MNQEFTQPMPSLAPKQPSPLPHPMPSHTKLVPIRISEIRAVVIRVVLGPQAGRSFASAAVGQRQGVHVLHLLA